LRFNGQRVNRFTLQPLNRFKPREPINRFKPREPINRL